MEQELPPLPDETSTPPEGLKALWDFIRAILRRVALFMSGDLRQRVFSFIEHPLFLVSLGTICGLVGMFFYTPVLIVCGICILLAFHRAGVVKGQSTRTQVTAYGVLFILTTMVMYGLGSVIRRHIPTFSEFAEMVAKKIKVEPSKQQEQSVQTTAKTATSTPQHSPEPVQSFAATVEMRAFSPGGGYLSGHWLRWQGTCVISPIDALLFLRVTNLRANKLMITGYRLEVKDQNEWVPLHRLDLRSGYTIMTPRKNTPFVPGIGRVINFPSAGAGGYVLRLSPEDVSYKNAAVLDLSSFDSQIGEKYLAPGESARGWAAFDYRQKYHMGDKIRLTVVDELGKSYPILAKIESGSRSVADIMPHLMTVVGVADLSNCRKEMLLY